jgi:hypothetical protein
VDNSGPHEPPANTARCQLVSGWGVGATVLATPAYRSSVDELPVLAVSPLDASLEANRPAHCGSACWTTAAVCSSGGPSVSCHIQISTNS